METVRPERGSASEAGALEAENSNPRGLRIPRFHAMRNVGNMSIRQILRKILSINT
ncbi:hypothetical protein [Dapis sp. BLCC M229]|uniref:hypothetical protein n=1 Tax=Dapis sp. BLCC M229 TaxID=3400188 RepID=UPI003CF0FE24